MSRSRQLKNGRWVAFGLSVVGTLVLLAVIVGGSVLVGNTTGISSAPVSYKILDNYLDLAYPNTTEDLAQNNNLLPSVPSNVDFDKVGFLVTNDSWQVVRDYYTQKFQSVGFPITDAYGCSGGQCPDAAIFSVNLKPADKPELELAAPYQINFVIISANAADAEFAKSTVPQTIRQSLKPNTTLIAFVSASINTSGLPTVSDTP